MSSCERRSHLQAALDALSNQKGCHHRFDVLVVDPVGDEKTVELLRTLSPAYTLRHQIVHDHPRSIDLRNRALRHVRGRYAVFCTSCFVARPHFLSTLERLHEDCPDAVFTIDDCLVVPRRALRKVGGFFDALQGSPLSVWELVYRLQKEGYPWMPVEETVGDRLPRADTPVDARHLRLLYKKHGCKEFELNLMAVMPPWEDAKRYWSTLQAYWDCRHGSPEQQAAARSLRRACKMAAQHYLD